MTPSDLLPRRLGDAGPPDSFNLSQSVALATACTQAHTTEERLAVLRMFGTEGAVVALMGVVGARKA